MARFFAALLLAAFAVTVVTPAAAQTSNEPVEIIFGDGDDVLGGTLAPEETVVNVREPSKFESLIQLRKDFRKRMLGSVAEL